MNFHNNSDYSKNRKIAIESFIDNIKRQKQDIKVFLMFGKFLFF